MATRIARLLLGALLPLWLMVALVGVICDLFHFNKGEDYIRLSDQSAEVLIFGFIYELFVTTMFFGIPCLLYSILLEWRRNHWESRLAISVGFGTLFGLCVGCEIIPPFKQCKFSDFAEGAT